MRTARLLPVSPSMHCSGGCTCLGGVPARGVYLPGGLPARGGVPAQRGVPAQVLPPPWTEFLTHATENITLPQTSFAGGKNMQLPSDSCSQDFAFDVMYTMHTIQT